MHFQGFLSQVHEYNLMSSHYISDIAIFELNRLMWVFLFSIV